MATSNKGKATAKTNKAPVGVQKPVPTGKGAKAEAAKQAPGKRTMIGGKNRAQKVSGDTPV